MSNKEIVLRAMREFIDENDITALDRYWIDSYIEHNPNLRSGTEGLRRLSPFLKGFSWRAERIIEEGDLVVAHSRLLGADVPVITVDIFRLVDDRIVEHWDVSREETPAHLSITGNPMI